MKPEKLVAMANQIATFFRSYPDEEAAAGITRHVVSFWTPDMRATLERYIEQDGPGVDALVAAAFQQRQTAESPVKRVTSPVQEAGQMATDAG